MRVIWIIKLLKVILIDCRDDWKGRLSALIITCYRLLRSAIIKSRMNCLEGVVLLIMRIEAVHLVIWSYVPLV